MVQYNEIKDCMMDAVREVLDSKNKSKSATPSSSVAALLKAANAKLLALQLPTETSMKKLSSLTSTTVYRWAEEGVSSITPHGNASTPSAIFNVLTSFVRASQVSANSATSKVMTERLDLCFQPTTFKNTPKNVLQNWKNLYPFATSTKMVVPSEMRRELWLTADNVEKWTRALQEFFVDIGFAVRTPSKVSIDTDTVKGDFENPITMVPGAEKWIASMDEKHLTFSNEPEKGGSRSTVCTAPSLPTAPPPRAIMSIKRHMTGVFCALASGTLLQSMFIFSGKEQLSVKAVTSLPGAAARCGGGTLPAVFALNEGGGMTDELFPKYIEMVIVNYFGDSLSPVTEYNIPGDNQSGIKRAPVFLQVDAGPGRISKTKAYLAHYKRWREIGIIIFLGIPNGTAANQAMDELYGYFAQLLLENATVMARRKTAAYVGEIKAGIKAPMPKMTYDDSGLYLSGDGTTEMRDCMAEAFTREKIKGAFRKTGVFPPMAYAVITKHRKVTDSIDRHIVTTDVQETVEDVLEEHRDAMEAVAELGFNATAFIVDDLRVPPAKEKSRVGTKPEWLAKQSRWDSGVVWDVIGPGVCLTSDEYIKAVELKNEVLDEEAAKKAAKKEASDKALEEAAHEVNNKKLGGKEFKFLQISALSSLTKKDRVTLVRYTIMKMEKTEGMEAPLLKNVASAEETVVPWLVNLQNNGSLFARWLPKRPKIPRAPVNGRYGVYFRFLQIQCFPLVKKM